MFGKKSNSVADTIINILIILYCIFALFPVYWLLTGAFKYSSAIIAIPPEWFPRNPTIENIQHLVEQGIIRWFTNSFLVSAVSTLSIVLVCSACAFAISKMHFPGKVILFAYIIATLVLPKETYLLPLYKMMVSWKWVGKLRSMIVPNVALPLGVYLIKNFYDTIPNEIMESASMDGCGKIRFFFNFGIPLSLSGIMALSIMAFVKIWNDYLWQFIMARSNKTFTLPVGVANMFDNPTIIDFGLKYAGAALTALPLLIVFMIFQRYFVTGVTAGAVKG